MMLTAGIYFCGILGTMLLLFIFLEGITKQRKINSMSEMVDNAEKPETNEVDGIRKTIQPLEKTAQKIASPKMIRKMEADLYWAQFMGQWLDWTPIQVISLQIFFALIGGVVGFVVFHKILFVAALIAAGWIMPQTKVNSLANRTRRQFSAQIIEYNQLVCAGMAGNVSMETSFMRTSKADSLPAIWMRRVIQKAQGRSITDQIELEAEKSQLPELISLSDQIRQMGKGASQLQLLDDLTEQMTDEYTNRTDMRVQAVGTSTIVPIILLFFLPFVITIIVALAYPMITSMG